MSATNADATTLLLRHVHRLLKHVVTDLSRVRKLEADCKKHVESLANLLHQRQVILKVGLEDLAWTKSEFPDLQGRLLVKISAEVDTKVDILQKLMLPLKEHHDSVSRARAEILRLLQKNGEKLDRTAMHDGSPTVPPLQVMLGWVDGLETELRELYYSRVHYLENILQPEVVSPDNLAQMWMQSSALLNILQDCEEQTRFFFEEMR